MGTRESLSFLRMEKEISQRERREKLAAHSLTRPDIIEYKKSNCLLGIDLPDEVYLLLDMCMPQNIKVDCCKINKLGNRKNQEILRTLRLINVTGGKKYFEDMCNIYDELKDEDITRMVKSLRYPMRTSDTICDGSLMKIKGWWPCTIIGETLLRAVNTGLKSTGVDNYYYIIFEGIRDTLDIRILKVLLGIIDSAGCGSMIYDVKDVLPAVTDNPTVFEPILIKEESVNSTGNSTLDEIAKINKMTTLHYEGDGDEYGKIIYAVEKLVKFTELSDCLSVTSDWVNDEQYLNVLRKCAKGERKEIAGKSKYFGFATSLALFKEEAIRDLKSEEFVESVAGGVQVTYKYGLKREYAEIFMFGKKKGIVIVDHLYNTATTISTVDFEKTMTLIKLAREY